MLNQWTNRVISPGFIMWATVLRLFGCLASLDGPLVTNSLFFSDLYMAHTCNPCWSWYHDSSWHPSWQIRPLLQLATPCSPWLLGRFAPCSNWQPLAPLGNQDPLLPRPWTQSVHYAPHTAAPATTRQDGWFSGTYSHCQKLQWRLHKELRMA